MNKSAISSENAGDLAKAYLRRRIGKERLLYTPRASSEQEHYWLFDFYYPNWRSLRKTPQPFGIQLMVEKKTGRTTCHAPLVKTTH